MRLLGLFVALSLSFGASLASAEDLFIGGKPGNFQPGQAVAPQSTIGGYPIYSDAEGWRIVDISAADGGAVNGAEPVKRGRVILTQVDGNGASLAHMVVVANLVQVGTNQFMMGEPCGGSHLVTLKKRAGTDDNCVTVDVEANGSFTYFSVRATQTRANGRMYFMFLGLGADALGFSGTGVADWDAEAVKADANKAALVEKIKTWATQLQEGTEKAIGFTKPADAFAGVPSYRTLLAAK